MMNSVTVPKKIAINRHVITFLSIVASGSDNPTTLIMNTMCLVERKKKIFVIHSLFVKVYFYEQIVESTTSSNKGN